MSKFISKFIHSFIHLVQVVFPVCWAVTPQNHHLKRFYSKPSYKLLPLSKGLVFDMELRWAAEDLVPVAFLWGSINFSTKKLLKNLPVLRWFMSPRRSLNENFLDEFNSRLILSLYEYDWIYIDDYLSWFCVALLSFGL